MSRIFDEAKTVFEDPFARLISDPDHSLNDEDRFVILGVSTKNKTVVVCHCYLEQGEVIRIISARYATKHETLQYQELII